MQQQQLLKQDEVISDELSLEQHPSDKGADRHLLCAAGTDADNRPVTLWSGSHGVISENS